LDISVILVSYNTIEMTKKALNDLFASVGDIELEVLIVDNASRDNSVEVLRREYPNITLIENNKNVGFGRANNQALPFIKGRYVLLLNTDAFVEPDTLIKTKQYMDMHPKCGMVGVRLVGVMVFCSLLAGTSQRLGISSWSVPILRSILSMPS